MKNNKLRGSGLRQRRRNEQKDNDANTGETRTHGENHSSSPWLPGDVLRCFRRCRIHRPVIVEA